MTAKYPEIDPWDQRAFSVLLGHAVRARMAELELLDQTWRRMVDESEALQPLMQAEQGIVRGWSISRQQGVILHSLVRLLRPARLLELGGSFGYSTLWLAAAAEHVGARVVTVERDFTKIEILRKTASHFPDTIEVSDKDIGEVLAAGPQLFDFIFLDADPFSYPAWRAGIEAVLAPGGILVIDNALSPAPLAPLVQAFAGSLDFLESWTIPAGHGMLIMRRG